MSRTAVESTLPEFAQQQTSNTRQSFNNSLRSQSLCGLVGMLQFAGADYTLTEGTAGGVGFTAITVAWLSKMNPFGMLVVSVFIAMLERGSNTIQTNFKIPASASDLIIGIILFFMLGCEFFITYKLIPRRKEEHHD